MKDKNEDYYLILLPRNKKSKIKQSGGSLPNLEEIRSDGRGEVRIADDEIESYIIVDSKELNKLSENIKNNTIYYSVSYWISIRFKSRDQSRYYICWVFGKNISQCCK